MKSSENHPKSALKFILGIFVCLLFRLIPFRAPNIEPILAAMMPFSRAYGMLYGVLFGAGSILLYDSVTKTLGAQTFFTLGAYVLLAIMAARYFKDKNNSASHYVRFAIFGTLFFDAATGLTVGPIFFDQPMTLAVIGQIPFTALHLLGNIVLAYLLSPEIYHYLIRKKKKEAENIITNLNPKTI